MDSVTRQLLSAYILYKPTWEIVERSWDNMVRLLSEQGLDALLLLQWLRESETSFSEEQLDKEFGNHIIHKLAKAALVFAKWETLSESERTDYRYNIESSVSDLIQIFEYAREVPADERSYLGCISRERR